MRAPQGETRSPSIAIVGSGRAGAALAVALATAGHPVVAVSSRHAGRAAELADRVGGWVAPSPLAAMRVADLTFLTVPDAAVTGVAASVAATGAALRGRGVVHCSASLGVGALAALRLTGAEVGSLHPLQALAGAGSAPLLRGAAMAVDGDPGLRDRLHRLVLALGGHPLDVREAARPLYHAAAVLAGNAPLALLAAATELLRDAGVDPAMAEEGLTTLMHGALSNASRLGARDALTGPVVRNDVDTVASHLEALEEHPAAADLYRAIARETLRLAGGEGREEIVNLLNRAPEWRTPLKSPSASGHRPAGSGVHAERRLGAGGISNAAEPSRRPHGPASAAHASQGVPTSAPERSITPEPAHSAEASPCR